MDFYQIRYQKFLNTDFFMKNYLARSLKTRGNYSNYRHFLKYSNCYKTISWHQRKDRVCTSNFNSIGRVIPEIQKIKFFMKTMFPVWECQIKKNIKKIHTDSYGKIDKTNWNEKDRLPKYSLHNNFFYRFGKNFSALFLCIINVSDTFNMIDFFRFLFYCEILKYSSNRTFDRKCRGEVSLNYAFLLTTANRPLW